eukprot:CAMPEP_0202443356 /NCGR_PEP_ID=MMETSP1360-20130828/2652_1 /ASSEMBLY_ACC=CAM_ASM_000848 /TAXON_ID=515479 /ORGANISM="Licmophora paradoxa, Strain CCMP2313" /LENGTH=228 /DNA_ID=CAMNT_0049059029 /DNA_START=143 /DNA_END=826 /DNA_ORIENTATION=+
MVRRKPVEELPSQDLTATFERVAVEDNVESKISPTTSVLLEREEDNIIIDTREEAQPLIQETNTHFNHRMGPPTTIALENRGTKRQFSRETTQSLPYAQLCYDMKKEEVVPVLEASNESRSYIDQRVSAINPTHFPPLYRATDSPCSETVSTLTVSDEEPISSSEHDPGSDGPILRLGEDLNTYLLLEFRSPHPRNNGYTKAFQRLVRSNVRRLKRKRKANIQDKTPV